MTPPEMFMHFKTSSERKQSPNKLFQGDTLSPKKVKLHLLDVTPTLAKGGLQIMIINNQAKK